MKKRYRILFGYFEDNQNKNYPDYYMIGQNTWIGFVVEYFNMDGTKWPACSRYQKIFNGLHTK